MNELFYSTLQALYMPYIIMNGVEYHIYVNLYLSESPF